MCLPTATKKTTAQCCNCSCHEEVQKLRQEVHALTARLEGKEQELQDTNRRHEEVNAQIKAQAAAQLEHFACMSHEIRTPLNCIVGMSSLLLDTCTRLDDNQAESVRMIATSGDLLSTIVDDVLDFSKLECGDLVMDIKRTNLQHTLDSVVSAIQLKCDDRQRDIVIRTLYGVRVPKYCQTDSARLSQCLFNLLGNAVKFSTNNSYVDLRVDIVDTPAGQSVMQIKVKDYGRGIHKQDLSVIFEPFRQANEAETGTVYGGTGLGLPITSKLVHCLGGTLSVDSEYGQWTEFVIDLPHGGDQQEEVDLKALQQEMEGVTTIFCSSKPSPECPVLEAYRRCDLNWRYVPNCDKLQELVLTGMTDAEKEEGHFIVCMNGEDYDAAAYKVFQDNTKSHLLITFGNQNTAPKVAAAHVRSMARVLPSVLLPAFARAAREMKIRTCQPKVSTKRSSTLEEQEAQAKKWKPSTLAYCENDKRPRPQDNQTQSFQHYSILIAEDNKVNQKVLKRTLHRLGLQDVDVVDNGQQAVEATACRSYSLVFMDMEMPVLGGVEACRQILARGDADPPRIVFLTAHATAQHKAEATAAGGRNFLTKPFNLAKIQSFFEAISREDGSQQQQPQQQPPMASEGAGILPGLECVPSEAMLPAAVMVELSNQTKLSLAECREKARDCLDGTDQCVRHNYFNYRFYLGFIKDQPDIRPTLLSARNEYKWHDFDKIHTILGGKNLSLETKAASFAVRQTSAHRDRSTTLIPQGGRIELCRHVCSEIEIYVQALFLSVNLDEKERHQSLQELNQSCQTQSVLKLCNIPAKASSAQAQK